jgi:hypothetical protein
LAFHAPHANARTRNVLGTAGTIRQRFGPKRSLQWLRDPSLTHQEIADTIGSARERVTKLFSEFRSNGDSRVPSKRLESGEEARLGSYPDSIEEVIVPDRVRNGARPGNAAESSARLMIAKPV